MTFIEVYRGGHHEVYCNKTVHYKFLGSHLGSAPISLPNEKPHMLEIVGPYACDCAKYKRKASG